MPRTRNARRKVDIESSSSSMDEASCSEDINDCFKRLTKPSELDNEQLEECDKRSCCNHCHGNFASSFVLRQHILTTHLQSEPERYECLQCHNVVTELQEHFNRHKHAKHTSAHCGHSFSSAVSFHSHQYIRERETSWQCTICPRRLVSIKKSKAHRSLHDKHRDAAGNYLPLVGRLQRHPDYDLANENDSKSAQRVDSKCGGDVAGVCIKHDTEFTKLRNTLVNSKCCDTSGLDDHINEFGARAAKVRRIC